MTTNFLYTQAPNRKGNQSKHAPTGTGGVTAITCSMGGLSQPKGSQGAPKCMGATSNTSAGATGGRKQKVMVQTNCTYDGKIHNDGYMNSDRTNYLK